MNVKEIEKYEIQEIAGTILKEIFAERKRSGAGQAQEPGFGEVSKVGRGIRDFSGGVEIRRNAGSGGVAFSEGSDRNGTEASAEEQPFLPRLQRRDFMALRAERRSRRGAVAGGVATAEEEGRLSFAESGPGFDERLPEKLSEAFCRDARRYDGAFERY